MSNMSTKITKEKEKETELKSMTAAFFKVRKVLKRYVYFKDKSYYVILSLYIMFTYCFKLFDSLPYILITGPYGTGKTLILQILKLLCYKALPATSISPAGFYHVIDTLNGTLLIDEVEEFAKKIPHGFDMAVILNGYKRAGFVVRVDPRKRRLIKYKCYGPKVIANTGGIFNRALLSRCLLIRTVHSERKLERFLVSRDGELLKQIAKGLKSLFEKRRIQEKIRSFYYDFNPIEGLVGRDEELWIGLLVLAQIIDLKSPRLKLFDCLSKIAMAYVEKRKEHLFFDDWTSKVLVSVYNFILANSYDSNTLIQADKITRHVVEELHPAFRLRTEGLGRILDKESLLIERKLMWFKDGRGNPVHRTGWRIDVVRLKKRMEKFKKYMPPPEDPQSDDPSISDFLDIFDEDESEKKEEA